MGDSPGRPPALQGPSKGSRWTWQASAASSLTGFPPNGVPPLTGFPGLPGGIARLLLVLVLVRVPCLLMFHVSGS